MITRRGVLNAILLLVLLATFALNVAVRPDLTRPNLEYFPNMAHSPRYNAFGANPNFPDGKTLQAPPEGSIPRGFLPIHYSATPQDALLAGEELLQPLPANDPVALERGAVVFKNFCQECHGPAGKGDGPVALRGFPPPPPLAADHAVKMKDGQLFHILTYGQGNMPSYASQLSRDDRWQVILYVRTLQRAPAAASAPVAAVKGAQP